MDERMAVTLLAVPVFARSLDELRRRLAAAAAAGADLIELRLDLLEGVSDEDLWQLRREGAIPRPLLLTIRSVPEGGAWDGPEDERIARLIRLGPIADYLDVELAAWRRSANLRQKVGLALRRAGRVSQEGGREEIELAARRKLILSRHDLRGRPPALHADWVAMLEEPLCGVVKLAWPARTVRDNFEAFDLLRDSPRPAVVICLGEAGLPSRVLAPKFGAFAGFAALAEDAATAPGQLSAAELRETYHWADINSSTLVYGVIGDPVRHSLGRRVHNPNFRAVGWNGVYLPWEVAASWEAFKAFMVEVLARPWLDARGFSVTLPHKENALRFVREAGGTVDPAAARIGAVNTLSLTAAGHLTAYNTDGPAAVEAIVAGLGLSRADELKGRKAAVLGAGGVARAVVAELTAAGADLTIYNRSLKRGQRLAAEFGCRCREWGHRAAHDADLVVNCTSLGMRPGVGESPMPAEGLRAGLTVFDTVYNPLRTRLLDEAAARGCQWIDGLEMYVRQARAQFRIWTGHTLDLDALRQQARSLLET